MYPNVFVLCTGRCGSVTFSKACLHITNYTSSHESVSGKLGDEKLFFPANYIEIDNRLTWFLGTFDKIYGDDCFYVHLQRDMFTTAVSFQKRWGRGIMQAYSRGMLRGHSQPDEQKQLQISLDYCRTVNDNIALFLKDKSYKMEFHLENGQADFEKFWHKISAQGNLEKALSEWQKVYNPSGTMSPKVKANLGYRIVRKTKRVVEKFPSFLISA